MASLFTQRASTALLRHGRRRLTWPTAVVGLPVAASVTATAVSLPRASCGSVTWDTLRSAGTKAGSSTTETFMKDPADFESFRKMGHEMVDFVADYYRDIDQYPVKSQVAPGYLREALPSAAPAQPESFEAVMKDLQQHIVPGVTHWQAPGFYAFFPANSSAPSMLGDMASSMFGCVAFSWVASPAATELETIVMDWLAKLLQLPESFMSDGAGGGVIQGSASEATLVALLAARQRAMDAAPAGSDATLYADKLVVYTSNQAHSSVIKAATIAGIPKANVRVLTTKAEDGYKLTPAALQEAMDADEEAGLVPTFCGATVGSTSAGYFDPISDIGLLCQKRNVWVHVDAAWAGSAAICPEHRHILNGVEHCDSMAFNPHKWLLTNFDCCAMWVKERAALLNALSITPAYLRSKEYDSGLVTDYRDWQVPLGRRFRSLKLWFVLRMFGSEQLQQYIRQHVALAEHFEALVRSDDRFELTVDRSLSLVCFHLKGSDAQNAALLEEVNASGDVYFVSSHVAGRGCVIRCAIGSPRTTQEHVDAAWATLQAAATRVLAGEVELPTTSDGAH